MAERSSKSIEISRLPASDVIHRPELLREIKKKTARKNIFITAPGGYGKTTVISEWLSSERGASASLTMGDADNDPNLFYRRLASALLGFVGKGKVKSLIPVNGLSLDRFLELLSAMPAKSPICYLVLDDLHMLKNDELINSLPLLVNRLPAYVRLCLISRSEPSVALLETGRFEVLTADDLLFTREETQWLCAERALSLTPERIDEILEASGGWAMYLSALLSGDYQQGGEEKPPETLTQYLETRIWSQWEQETRLLLLRLAVPSEITPELCARLTGSVDGRLELERLMKSENAFLSRVGEDTYRFHDIFRDFLLERTVQNLSSDEIRRANDTAAAWYYECGRYYESARHYIANADHEGINRCLRVANRFHEDAGSMSVEVSLNFTKQYVMNLTSEFIAENLYLLCECTMVAYYDGDGELFLKYADMLYQRLPEIAAKYPDLMESAGFIGALDYRVPLAQYVKTVVEMLPLMSQSAARGAEANSNTITQNLPYFHRSMRDFSEYYELKDDDMELLGNTFGVMIGKDYDVMKDVIYAGIYYERGNLTDAARHALNGYHICGNGMQPETVFCAHMIAAAVYYALGASREAKKVMDRMGTFIESRARFLRPNFKALQTEHAIREGSSDAAKEWLAVYAYNTGYLPFYQMCRHFTTLRSYIAVKDYATAADFGKRLHELAGVYRRPLDQIESGILTAIALWHKDEKNKAIKQLEQALIIAAPYGFIQQFVNESKEITPILWALRERTGKPAAFKSFVDKIIEESYGDLGGAGVEPPRLTKTLRDVLTYLDKGMSYNQIAAEMGVTHGTAKGNVLRLYKRLGVRNTQEAVVKAKMLGVLGLME